MDYSYFERIQAYYHQYSWNLEDELHYSKFETSILLSGCKVRLIINHPIPDNYISENMAHQMGLQIYLNPHPYYVTLSHNHGFFEVTQMCTLTLNLGTFSQVVFGYIVPTSACHIVLGSSWCDFNKVEYSHIRNRHSCI